MSVSPVASPPPASLTPASPHVTALRVANEAFLVSSTIERCPKTMMIRELVVNAIEAARASAGEKRVDILGIAIEGVPKLCIRNTGQGLTAAELDRICDLASSLNKINSLDANFGMGAKVASLPSNKHGMRYRSCRDGVVSEVILCQREGVYGRLHRGEDAEGMPQEVIDATEACRAEGLVSLAHDWTEVVLFGNSAGQNTVLDPYAGNPRSERDWLAKNLLLRFFRVPAEVSVTLAPDVLGTQAPVAMGTLAAAPSGQSETVRTPSGVILHYRYDPGAAPATAPSPFATGGGMGCIVYKDEVYDPRTEARWALDAPSYGVSFGAKYISVFVELPDDYLVRPEAYRQFLRFRGGDQRQVFLTDFGQLVTAYIPPWLKQVIRGYGPQQADFLNDVAEELRALVEELDIAPEFVPPRPPAAPKPEAVAQAPRPPASDAETKARQLPPATPQKPPAPPPKRFEQPPEIIGLDNEEMIAERGLKGRAGKFYPSSHQLFVNLHYPTVDSVAGRLEAEFFESGDAETLRSTARSVAGWAVTRRIARALIYSLTKKAAGWPAEDVKRAQSPESFSLVADDWQAVMETARLRMAEALSEDTSQSLAA
jgi:hypothetical protein